MKLNRELFLNNYTFNISIELLTSIEKKIGGKREHTVIVNDMGASNYYQKYIINDANLNQEMNDIFDKTAQWVDNKSTDDNTIKILKTLGFK